MAVQPVGADTTTGAMPAVVEQRIADIAAAHAGDGSASDWTPSEQLATLCEFGADSLTWALAGDSTGSNDTRWPTTLLRLLADRVPDEVALRTFAWNEGGDAWNTTPTVVQAGSALPPEDGVMMHDTFTRTGELVGSTSDSGGVWLGQLGKWAGTGTAAKSVTGTDGLGFDATSTTSKLEAKVIVTSANHGGVAGTLRFHIGAGNLSLIDKGLYAELRCTASGNVTFGLYKRFGGTLTTLVAADGTVGFTQNSSTPTPATITIEVDGQNVEATITVGGTTKTQTATITETDVAELGTFAGMRAGTWTEQGVIDEVTISVPTGAARVTGLTLHNASVAGSRLEYQQERLTQMFGSIPKIDVMIVSAGHNYGGRPVPQFLSEVQAFVTAYRAQHPESLILVTSQNPRFSPASAGSITDHAMRQAALRRWARESGFEYVPAFERFSAESDGGASLVLSDGIHPTTPPSGDLGVQSGSRTWAEALLSLVDQRITSA